MDVIPHGSSNGDRKEEWKEMAVSDTSLKSVHKHLQIVFDFFVILLFSVVPVFIILSNNTCTGICYHGRFQLQFLRHSQTLLIPKKKGNYQRK